MAPTKRNGSPVSRQRKCLEIDDEVVDGVFEDQLRRRSALEATEFTTYEGAVMEWLCSSTAPERADLRARFGHGLQGVQTESLEKIQALIRGIVNALRENDREALSQVAGFWDVFFCLEGPTRKLQRAVELVDSASKRIRFDDDVPTLLAFMLTALDERLGVVPNAELRELLLKVRHDGKGGSGNISPRGAVAKLLVKTKAFDIVSEKDAKKKIHNAFEAATAKTLKPKKAPKRA